MLLSIVIPAFNEARLLGGNLKRIRDAMANSCFQTQDWEMIVCDNNSTDDTAAIALLDGAKVVFEPHNQIALARNKGAEVARGEWLLFVDADTFPNSALMDDVFKIVHNERIIGAGFGGEFYDATGIGGYVVLRISNYVMKKQRSAAGAFFLCRDEHFKQLGGFNSNAYAAEDIELAARLMELSRTEGFEFAYRDEYRFKTSARKLNARGILDMLCFFAHLLVCGKRVFLDKSKLKYWYRRR